MANPRPPAKLNFQDPNWDAWRSAFQTFRAETNLDQEDDEIQIATLMYSMGPESERVLSYFDTCPTRGTHDKSHQVHAKSYNDFGKSYNTTYDETLGMSHNRTHDLGKSHNRSYDLGKSHNRTYDGKSHRTYDQDLSKPHRTYDQDLSKPHNRTYDEVLGKFDWYFKAKKKNLMTLRRAFQNRVQLRSETMDEFCDSLKKCGLECEFVDLEERVRDQFVFGVRNKGLSEKLEQLFVINPVGYTLEKVVLAAKAFERSYAQDFLSIKPKDNRDTLSLKPKDNRDTLSLKPKDNRDTLSLKSKDNRDTLSLKPKDNRDTLSLKPKDNRDTLSLRPKDNRDTHKQKEINSLSLKQMDVDILSLKQKDMKEKRVRSLKGSIKIMAPCPEL